MKLEGVVGCTWKHSLLSTLAQKVGSNSRTSETKILEGLGISSASALVLNRLCHSPVKSSFTKFQKELGSLQIFDMPLALMNRGSMDGSSNGRAEDMQPKSAERPQDRLKLGRPGIRDKGDSLVLNLTK